MKSKQNSEGLSVLNLEIHCSVEFALRSPTVCQSSPRLVCSQVCFVVVEISTM